MTLAQEITTDCSLNAYDAEFDGSDVATWDRGAFGRLDYQLPARTESVWSRLALRH